MPYKEQALHTYIHFYEVHVMYHEVCPEGIWSCTMKNTDLFIYLYIFKLINLFLFSYNCLHFLPFPPPHPVPPPSPTSTLPLDFVLVSFIVAPIDPSPHYPLPTSPWLLLQCS